MKVLWFANTPCGASEKLNSNPFIGGWLKSLEEQLIQEEIDLSVCFYWGESLPPFEYKGVSYYPILRKGIATKMGRVANRAMNQNSKDPKEIQLLLDVVNNVSPELIHIHGTEDNFGLIQGKTQVPIVISLQGILSPYCEKYFSGIPSFQSYLFEGLIPKLLFKSELLLFKRMKQGAVREREILFRARHVIGRTDWDRRITKVLAPNSKYFIGNEILRTAFYKNEWKKTKFDNQIQIVTIMSGGLYKGLETVVKTAQILSETELLDFKWTIIGQGESNDLAVIVKKWLKIDYKSLDIHLVGKKNENEVADILVNSDIYCQVSHIENSPNSVCEAMLIGLPIIASFAGGTDSMLENRVDGTLVQDGDPYSYAGAIIELAKDFEKANSYGLSAKKRARERHDRKLITNSLISSYRLISNNNTF